MLLAMLSLAGCETSGRESSQTFCTVASPVYFDTADKMSDRTTRAIIAHNEKGRKLCGWKPPPK